MKIIYLVCCLILSGYLAAQDPETRYNYFDVRDYFFGIELNDTSDIIRGESRIRISVLKKTDTLFIDLANKRRDGRGMVIDRFSDENGPVTFNHSRDRIAIPSSGYKENQVKTFSISYHGIPADGLIISKNKFGDRTFFGDNWPNRAHLWIPCIDHPADKARVEFRVKAPSHYRVVSNGICLEDSVSGGLRTSHWKTTVPLPTKLMVIGVADFAVNDLSVVNGIPVSSWVYPQNEKEGFSDYAVAVKPMLYYCNLIAPFPFSKLANVQSTTLYGGMENASCIFYSENSVTGKNLAELTIAHEIAHQWFGDAVTEKDWYQVWLSEGFASYLAALYVEETFGRSAFLNYMNSEKRSVLQYEKNVLSPVIDWKLSISDELLNPNTYHKASWVLHMLRRELGDSLFIQSIRNFYSEFKDKNAETADFRNCVEEISGRDFNVFFDQWLYKPGHPELDITWEFRDDQLIITVEQLQQNTVFQFPLELKVINRNSGSSQLNIDITSSRQTFNLDYSKNPAEIIPDPGNWLLMEYKITQRN